MRRINNPDDDDPAGGTPPRWSWRSGCVLLFLPLSMAAADIEEARELLRAGQYADCVVMAEKEYAERLYSEQWPLVLIEGLWTMGRYAEARTLVTNLLAQESRSIRLRWIGREVFLSNGEVARAAAMPKEILDLVQTRPWAYRDPAELVVFGRAALLVGVEPKEVFDRIYPMAKKADPASRDPYLAAGELALEKGDFALAAKSFQEGLKRLPKDPDLHYGLARAYAPSEPALMLAAIETALEHNSNHVASLLLLADHLIDAEDYHGAEQLLDRARAVNPWHPETWAYRAVIAHLSNQPAREQASREMALKFWPTNPRVPHLIGRKLSQKYRFAEGAALQRQALRFDSNCLPAKAQLAQDLLRLGKESEGWRLAEEVQTTDAYDITALNLMTLHDTMERFATLTNDHFVVRMTPHEAALYGARVLELLEEARQRLCAKYGLELPERALVEIFADQKDFAVRTFGMPENHGFLGVCFGPVITANSPASRPGQPFNWEAMLWHEFTHVITLHLTRNKMPRWLSEGISVYEERQANPAWGQHMNPRYREMILQDELTPISKLSGAFLTPRSELHLQFAYYESSLVVEFLAERYGLEKIKAILRNLADGAEINSVIEKHTAPMATIEKEFAEFARQRAQQMAPGLDWEKPGLAMAVSGSSDADWTEWAKERPTNYWAMMQQAARFVDEGKWAEAKAVLSRLVELHPGDTGPESAYRLLAETHRALSETGAERKVLTELAQRDGEAVGAYQRLMELGTEAEDWPAVTLNARRYLAVNPLVPGPYRFLAQAAEAQEQLPAAIAGRRALLELDPPNPAEAHFNLARLLHRAGEAGARRHVLQALEDAPRYRAALKLLLEINEARGPMKTAAAALMEKRE